MKPATISFVTGEAKGAISDIHVTIVQSKGERSKIDVVVDQAGEACIKTPHAIPVNPSEKGPGR